MQRRPHRKSRHGCAECKRRRVKCDEIRPSCTTCSRRGATCIYDASASYLWVGDESGVRTLSHELERLFSSTAMSRFSYASTIKYNSQGDPSDLNLVNLELLLPWSTKTHSVFSQSGKTKPIWQFLVPEEALSHPFLMHGLLAVSAIHLASSEGFTSRADRLRTAAFHQSKSLAEFQTALRDINRDNSKAIFAFASILIVYLFAFLHLDIPSETSSPIADLYQVLMLCHGLRQVLQISSDFIQDSNFSPVIDLGAVEHPVSLPEDAQLALGRLYDTNNIQGEQTPDHDIIMYHDTISMVKRALGQSYWEEIPTNTAVRWAIKVPRQYLERLQERNQMALVILAFYCVVLHRLSGFWCFQGWGKLVIQCVWESLDPQSRSLAHWAVVEVLGDTHNEGLIES